MKNLRLLVLIAAAAADAHAARPFVTDDARLTTAGSCQLESWMRVYRHGEEFWALPACNPTGKLEFTVGGGQARSDSDASATDWLFQLKTLFRPLETNGWGWGLAAGTIRHPSINPGPNLFGNSYVYVPASFSFADDQVIVHANLGLLKERVSGRQNLTFGAGAEYRLSHRLMLIGETFGDNNNRPYVQIGGRFGIIPDKVQIDATLGQQLNGPGNSRWLSFGLRLTPDSLW